MVLGKFNSFHATLSKPLGNIRKKPFVFLIFLGSMVRDQWHEVATSNGQMRLHKQDYHSSVIPSSLCWSQFKGVSKAGFICYCNHFSGYLFLIEKNNNGLILYLAHWKVVTYNACKYIDHDTQFRTSKPKYRIHYEIHFLSEIGGANINI